MSKLVLGVVSGIVFGVFVAIIMLPMTFTDKRSALTAAFFNRLAVGVLIGASIGSPQLLAAGISPLLVGAAIGLLISLPDAIITKAWAPILIIGTIGGGVIGWVVGRFGA